MKIIWKISIIKPKIRSRSGFTLIEIMMAMGLYGVIFGSIAYLLISAVDTRRDAVVLNHTVSLANQYMNKAKNITEEKSKDEDIKGSPGYHYRYDIVEEEKNLFDSIEKVLGKETNSLLEGIDNQSKGLLTAGIIKTLHYTVVVSHQSGLEYQLHFYRVLNR